MGLDDILPDEAEVDESSSSGQKQQTSSNEWHKEIGSGRYEKKFTEEKWEEVKEVLHEEMGYVANEVLNSPAQERYEILHEAALIAEEEKEEPSDENKPEKSCFLCGNALREVGVELEEEHFCPQHSAVKIAKALNNE